MNPSLINFRLPVLWAYLTDHEDIHYSGELSVKEINPTKMGNAMVLGIGIHRFNSRPTDDGMFLTLPDTTQKIHFIKSTVLSSGPA